MHEKSSKYCKGKTKAMHQEEREEETKTPETISLFRGFVKHLTTSGKHLTTSERKPFLW